MKRLEKSTIRKILVISLTNIGDVVLTLPVVDILKRDFPEAKLSIIIGPKVKGLLEGNPHYERVHIYDKKQSPLVTVPWILQLRNEHFDLVVDLRHSAIPFLISPKIHTPLFYRKEHDLHMRIKHLNRLKAIYPFEHEPNERLALHISSKETEFVNQLLSDQVKSQQRFIVIAPGSAYHGKKWNEEGFAHIADHLIDQHGIEIILIGDEKDRKVAMKIEKLMSHSTVNVCGRTTLIQSTEIIRRGLLTIVNDSAPMHLASYFNRPVLALFGFTNPVHYGPWSKNSRYLIGKREENLQDHDQMINSIRPEDVLKAIKIDHHHVSFLQS